MMDLYEALRMLSVLSPIAIVFLWLDNRRLKERIGALEHGAGPDQVALPVADAPKDRQEEAVPAKPASTDRPVAVRPRAQPPARPAPEDPRLGSRVADWMKANWFYAISALSLALAGIFAAQYAAEQGLLSPAMRLSLAALFGACLIGSGEVIRRRVGDGEDVSTAYLPSVFSAAGLVTLFGVVLTAHSLYGMVDSLTALSGLVAVAVLSIALGWFYGPALAVFGLTGATVAPFLVGGEAGMAELLHGYFGIISLACLAINALKKWRWVSEVALALPFGAAASVAVLAGGAPAFVILCVALMLAGSVFLSGSTYLLTLGAPLALTPSRKTVAGLGRKHGSVLIVWAVGAAALLFAARLIYGGEQMVIVALMALALAAAAWARRAPAALDLAAISAAVLLCVAAGLSDAALPGAEATRYLAWLSGAAIAMSCLAMRSSARTTADLSRGWALLAAIAAPAMLVLLEATWPAGGFGSRAWWAGAIIATAALAVFAAERAARVDGEDRYRTSLAALCAMSLIALALFVLTTKAALSVALSVLVLGAVALDDRFRLRLMSAFVQAGVFILAYRTVSDPGLLWAVDAPWGSFLLAYLVPSIALACAWVLGRGMDRPLARAVIEGGFAVMAGAGVSVLILRSLFVEKSMGDLHAFLGLISTVWIIAAGASLRNAGVREIGLDKMSLKVGLPRLFRQVSGYTFLAFSGMLLMAGVTVGNPLLGFGVIQGTVGFSSLLLAYALPGLALIALGQVARVQPKPMRIGEMVAGSGLLFLYACLSVAQSWRGNILRAVPMGDGELWSYTVMLLVIGAGLLMAGLMRGSKILRYTANGVLVLAIGKVFLVDAPDLDGLVRAGSFLVLGLSLAGLAWINRRAAGSIDQKD